MSEGMTRYVVIGGGIAGVTCAETLSVLETENAAITLISASPLIKTVTNYVQVTRVGETFDVAECPLLQSGGNHGNLTLLHATVTGLSVLDKTMCTSDGRVIEYDKLCVCTGGKPKVIAKDNPYVVGIRDTETVKTFQKQIKTARRVVIIGNGGIATELVYELEGCQVIWVIKDKSIAHTFVDAGAGQFFMEFLNKDKDRNPRGPAKRWKYTVEESSPVFTKTGVMGGALGPDWAADLDIAGAQQICHSIHVEQQVTVEIVMSPEELQELGNGSQESEGWPVYVQLSNKKIYGCDLIVSATGVEPFTDMLVPGNNFELAADGGLKVNARMETTEKDVYAAGDVCTASWEQSPHWLQMRLWSQARQMGCYAAKCMVAAVQDQDISMDFCFELFTHITTFFGFKVILLGRFNAQGHDSEGYEVLLRVTKGLEYVKVILQNGKMLGAVLIGETDLEETFENLILNKMDLNPFKDQLLEPGIDIEDFFD